jgi:bifunctional DNase/RNase
LRPEVKVFLQVRVQGLFLDPITERPILVLRYEEGNRFLPIWIGAPEANAIALRLEGVEVPRPMTHDLMQGILEKLSAKVAKVLICDLQENTYFAQIVLSANGQETTIDARPSDAVALAVRTGAPIFVRDEIFDRAAETSEPTSAEEQVQRWLEGLAPEDLGRYEM